MIEKINGEDIWKPKYGEIYYLGYQKGKDHGSIQGPGTEVHAYFFGHQNGYMSFYRRQKDAIYKYSGYSDSKVHWLSDGDDEPSIAYIESSLNGKLKDCPEREFILEKLKSYETRDKKARLAS